MVKNKKPRGRPPKLNRNAKPYTGKKRGRPKNELTKLESTLPKERRGRPRKEKSESIFDKYKVSNVAK